MGRDPKGKEVTEMAKLVRACKAALGLRGQSEFWRWVHYHNL
jgi:hypothetical protein